jgi:urea transport system permease protein
METTWISRIHRRAVASMLFLSCVLIFACPSHAESTAPAAKPIPPEITQAFKDLKTADSDGRQKIYDLIAAKGDARLIPALKAYRDGSLLLRDGKLLIYGERVTLPDKGSVVPLVDALTGKLALGSDGQPGYFPKPDLTGSIRAPRSNEKKMVGELIATLSLLDPDPAVRISSIRDTAEHAARAIPDPADSVRFLDIVSKCSAALTAFQPKASADQAPVIAAALSSLSAAQAERPKTLAAPAPTESATSSIKSTLAKAQDAVKDSGDASLTASITDSLAAANLYQGKIENHQKVYDELPKTLKALKHQYETDSTGPIGQALRESIASIELVTSTDPQVRMSSAEALGKIGTSRAENLLQKIANASARMNDKALHDVVEKAYGSADRYQTEVHFIQNTFAGLSLGSILVLMALGLSIIFGLMGVINMAQGEFMMVGAFTTYMVAEQFKHFGPHAYEYYLIAAVPAAFLVSAALGLIVEGLVIRHLYGRPLDTLLATWGVGLVLIWAARLKFGDNVSIAPPRWMEGGWEVAPDLVFPLNRLYIIIFCVICIAIVYFVVNGTKLGLLLRATTQNREMANALGVPTRRVDGLTFAFGAGLAGLAGVAVPLYNKINPNMGQEYIVDCFMVVVVGGVGKLAGAVWAGLGLGFIGKYLESFLGSIPAMASGASVVGRVLVLLLIIVFLQWRPQGLFPPKGRNADA